MKLMEIDVTPHPSLLEKIGQASFSIWQSISELMANSLDAIPAERKADIYIEADLEHVAVKDNGIGMTQKVLEKAVRMAWPMQEVCPYGRDSKRIFGLGMKTACASLGRWWSIATIPQGSAKGYRVIFDFDRWAKKGDVVWKAELEELESSEVELPKGAISGTVVTVRKLKVKPIPDNLKKEISRAYLPHIRSGDKFYLNGELLREEPLDILPNTRVNIDRKIEGVRIHGWGALMKKGSLTHYGFHWYRKGQLIEAFNKSFIPNHPAYRQIIGELHADDMPVNFTKRGFEKETTQWKQAIGELPELFEKLLKEARKTRRERQPEPWTEGKLRDSIDVMRRVGGIVSPKVLEAEAPTDYLLPTVIDSLTAEEDEETQKEICALASRTPIQVGDTEIRWRHRFVSLGEEGPLVDYAIEGKNELLVITNRDSPFSDLIENDAVLAILNVAEAISRFLVEETNYNYIKAKRFRDVWLVNASAIIKGKI